MFVVCFIRFSPRSVFVLTCFFPLSSFTTSFSLDFCLSFAGNYIIATEAFFARNWPFRIRDVRESRPKRAKATAKCSCGNGRQHSRNVDCNINRVFVLPSEVVGKYAGRIRTWKAHHSKCDNPPHFTRREEKRENLHLCNLATLHGNYYSSKRKISQNFRNFTRVVRPPTVFGCLKQEIL